MDNNLITAKAKFVRGSAKKARIPVDIVRGMMVDKALPYLDYMPKALAKDVYKVVASAKSNAVNNFNLNPSDLVIYDIRVDSANIIRRFKAGSRGRNKPIKRQNCHIVVHLKSITGNQNTI